MTFSSKTLVSPRTHAASPARGARVLTTAALLVVLALTFLAAPPAPAAAAGGLEIGVQDDAVFRHRAYYDTSRAFEQARAINATVLRVFVPWSTVLGDQAASPVRPSRPVYNWSQFDGAVDEARANGLQPQLVLTGQAPAFATRDKQIGPMYPDARLFAEFARAAATHFKGRVGRYSIWNEPNWSGWLNGKYSPQAGRTYRSLYVAGYKAIKRSDPFAQVLIGETAPYYQRRRALAPLAFLRDAACVDRRWKRKRGCRPLVADGYAHHPYEFANGPKYKIRGADNVTMGTLSRLRGALHKLRRAKALRTPTGRAMPIYLTEWGYQSAGARALPDATRARYTKQAFEIARKTPGVRQLTQYLLIEPPAGYPGGAFNTAILTHTGDELGPYRALRSWAKKNSARIKRNPKK